MIYNSIWVATHLNTTVAVIEGIADQLRKTHGEGFGTISHRTLKNGCPLRYYGSQEIDQIDAQLAAFRHVYDGVR